MRFVIFGNSGSGKSTLALKIAETLHASHLDLDSVAWDENTPTQRRSLAASATAITAFTQSHRRWVIEGCYTSLIDLVAEQSDQLVFLNPGVLTCQHHCRNRPWEPHKYASSAEQDKNLPMLLEWVAAYETRDDEFSRRSHEKLFARHPGPKAELTSPDQVQHWFESLPRS